MTEPVVRIRELHKTYQFVPRPIRALAGISFDIFPGEVVALLGLNGAGKTTTVKSILNFIQPDKGSASIFGVDSRQAYSRERLSYLPEKISLPDELTGRELFDFLATLFKVSRAECRERHDRLLALVKLENRGHLPCGKLSKGMLQRLGLALTLFNKPELLILDEPLSGLDPLGIRMVTEVVNRQKQEGTTMLICAHQLEFVAACCQRAIIIHQGELRADLRLDQLNEPLPEYFFKVIGE